MAWNVILVVQETRQHDWLLNLCGRACLHGVRKILEGGTTLCWVYMEKFRSMWLPIREGIKDGWATISTMQFFRRTITIISSCVVMPNEMVSLYCRDYPLTNQPPVWFIPSTRIFHSKAVYMVPGSSYHSARKIQALGTSTTPCM